MYHTFNYMKNNIKMAKMKMLNPIPNPGYRNHSPVPQKHFHSFKSE